MTPSVCLRFRCAGWAMPIVLITAFALCAEEKEPAPKSGPASYYKDVRPILQRHCQGCHQPAKPGGKLVLTTYDGLKKGGDTGEGFVPGKPRESSVIDMISGDKPEMPKDSPPLTKEQVDLVKRWVAEGAKNDTPPSVADTISPSNPPVYRSPPVISALAYSPDGKLLAVSGYHEILLHQSDGSGVVARLIGISQRIESLAFSSDGKTLASACGSPGLFGELQLWDVAGKKLKHSIPASHDTIYGVSFSADGERVAFGCADNSARIVSVKDGKQLLRIDHHQDWVLGTCFAHDSKHLVTLGRDRALKLTEAATGSFIDDINKLLGSLDALVVHPRENQVVCGGEDGIPRLYQVFRTKARVMMDEDLNLVRAFEKQPGPVSALALSGDGSLLAVGSSLGGEVRIYRIADGQRTATLSGHSGGVYAVTFHPNGKQIATGGHDGQIRLFDVATGGLQRAFVPVPPFFHALSPLTKPALVIQCGRGGGSLERELVTQGYDYKLVKGNHWNGWGPPATKSYCWYDPQMIQFEVTVPAGVAGKLAMHVLDADNLKRKEQVTVDGKDLGKFEGFDGVGKVVEANIAATDTKDGKIEVTIRNLGPVNCVVSAVEFVPAEKK